MWLSIRAIRRMMRRVAGEPESTATASDGAWAPNAHLRVEMPVLDPQGETLGRVAALHHDALSRRLTGLTVRHGTRGRKLTDIVVDDMASISQGAVILNRNKAAFGDLPFTDAMAKGSKATQTWPR